jgi:hypothetical protein
MRVSLSHRLPLLLSHPYSLSPLSGSVSFSVFLSILFEKLPATENRFFTGGKLSDKKSTPALLLFKLQELQAVFLVLLFFRQRHSLGNKEFSLVHTRRSTVDYYHVALLEGSCLCRLCSLSLVSPL